MKEVYKALIRSLGITVGVSVLGGLSTTYLLGNFMGGFLGLVVIQLILGYVLSVQRDMRNEATREALEGLEGLSTVPRVSLNCAYCKVANMVPIDLNTDNVFQCANCTSPNRVYVQFTPVRLTVPMSSNPLDAQRIDLEPVEDTVRQSTVNENVTIRGETNGRPDTKAPIEPAAGV